MQVSNQRTIIIEAPVSLATYGKIIGRNCPCSRILSIAKSIIRVGINTLWEAGSETKYLIHSYTKYPLHIAASRGWLKTTKALIILGATIDKPLNIGGGFTPLLLAIKNEHIDVVKCLIQAKADVNYTNQLGQFPLLEAVNIGSLKMTQLLINSNAKLNNLNIQGFNSIILVALFSFYRPSRNEERRQIVSELATASPKAFQQTREAMLLKQIAHLSNIGGALKLKGLEGFENLEIEVEGTASCESMAQIIKDIKIFRLHFPDLIAEEAVVVIEKAYRSGLVSDDITQSSMSTLFNDWKSGQPILLTTGFPGHSASVLLWEDHFSICERANIIGISSDGSKDTPLIDYPLVLAQFNKELLSENVLSNINNIQTIENYVSIVHNEIPVTLRAKLMPDSIEEIVTDISLPRMKVPNCSWANLEGHLFPLLVLQANKSLNSANSIEEIRALVNLQKNLYENFKSFMLINLLSVYLNQMKLNELNYEPQIEFLLKIFAENYPKDNIDPRITSLWEQGRLQLN